MVNICGSNAFDLLLTQFTSILVDNLPAGILSKIDQWNRIFINNERAIPDTELSMLIQTGALFDIPLIELPPNSGTRGGGSGSKNSPSTNLYHFSAFINEKYSVMDTPTVISIDTGDFNITWTKLKQFMFKVFKFVELIYSKKDVRPEKDQPIDPFINYVLAMQLNLISTSFLSTMNQNLLAYQMLEKVFEMKNFDSPTESYCANLYPHFVGNAFFILTVFNHALFDKLRDRDQNRIKKIFHNSSLHFCHLFEKILKKNSGKQAFVDFLCDGIPMTPTGGQPDAGRYNSVTLVNHSFLNLIEVSSHPMVTSSYAISVMRLMKTLLSQAEKFSDDINLIRLCSELSSALADRNDRVALLTSWFESVLFRNVQDENLVGTDSKNMKKFFIDDSSNANLYLIFKFVSYVIKGTSRLDEIVLSSIAEAVINNVRTLINDTSIESNGIYLYFSGLFTALVYLMSATGNSDALHPAGEPVGHFKLINEVIEWLDSCQEYLSNKETLKNSENLLVQGKRRFMLEACYQMLAYLSDIFSALEYKFVYLKNRPKDADDTSKKSGEKESRKNPVQMFIDDDSDCEEDVGPSAESDGNFDEEDEEDLCNQLCTFTQTGRDFIHQHWYHCHTCKMLEGVGVCTVCAKVCHRNHDITYSKYGSFFCDCGAKPDRSCKALVKRTPSAAEASTSKSSTPTSSLKKRSQTVSKSSASSNSESKKTFNDKKRMMRISKYWYTSFYAIDSRHSKLSDNYKLSKNKFSNQTIVANYDRFGLKYEQFENYSNLLLRFITPISDIVLSLTESFVPVLEDFFRNESELGYLSKIRKQFALLRGKSNSSLPMETCEQMMVPVKNWPDTIFENVQISNEQSHSVRHLSLITGAVVRRVSMLAIGSSQTNLSQVYPCLLVVAHDKNRVSIVNLNHLLGMVYLNARKKLNPQKIASITFPFTIMTISHNPLNDELVAVCGLKECHVLQLVRNGAVTAHYALSMVFDNNNHIVKTFWFPDSQTELVVVTMDFIKIYDLSQENRDTPVYNFVIPSRKIRDMTFFGCEVNGKPKRFILIFSSRGHIYAQELNVDSQCSTSNDVFYVTSILNVSYPESWSPSCQQTLVGFSIYYSHLLQMLFVSYLNGNSFCAPFGINNIHGQQIDQITMLVFNSTPSSSSSPAVTSSSAGQSQESQFMAAANGTSTNSSGSAPASSSSATAASTTTQLPLFQWTEVGSHPGLVFALTMNANNPVCFMVKSNAIKVQELKPKKKVIDLVAVSTVPSLSDRGHRPATVNGHFGKITTLVLLCDDGSLRFYRATHDQTSFWLPPHFSNLDDVPAYSALKDRAGKKPIRSKSNSIEQSGASLPVAKQHRFPVDFFERCTLMNDIEFGGSDVLEVYNTQQIKNRLQSANMYIACTKPNGFSITISQTGALDQVMAGVRVNLGVVDPGRAPTAIEVFGRTITVAITRQRWFDIPFTRSEMKTLVENPTFSIRFAPSVDHNQVTIVETIRVYGRSRDSIGLNADEEVAAPAATVNTAGSAGTMNIPLPPAAWIDLAVDPTDMQIFPTSYRSSSASTIKSPVQKLRLMLYAPILTDDEIVSTVDSKYQMVFVLNRMVANSLDVLESLFSFTKSLSEMNVEPQSNQASVLVTPAKELVNAIEYQQNCDIALSIASKLLTISLSSRLDKSICMLMAKLVPNRTAYDEHRGEIIFENAIENLKQRAYDDINVFSYNLSLFRETVNEHPRNFVRFIGKYFTQSSDVHASTVHFCSYLTDLFGRLYSQRPANELLSPLTKIGQYCNLASIIECLVFILYSSAYAVLSNASDSGQHETQQKIIGKTSQLVIQLLCSTDPQISHSTKKPLFKIFYSMSSGIHRHVEKQAKTSSSKSSSGQKPHGGHRERRHSGIQPSLSASSSSVDYLSNYMPPMSDQPSTSSGGGSLRRQNATRRIRSSGASSSSGQSLWSTAARNSTAGQGSSSGLGAAGGASSSASLLPSGSVGRTAASLLERVTESLLDNDFDPYHNLILNIDSEFPYFQDLMANLRRNQDQEEEVYESIAGEDDDDDDDEDEEDDDEDEDVEELDLAAIPQPEGNSSSAPPPLYPISPYAEEGNGIVQQPSLEEVLDDAVRMDDEDDERDDEDDEDDEFEAMDEDEMMEIAIALSLQEQQREPRAVEEIADYEGGVDVPEGRDVEPQAIAAFGQIVQEIRSRQQQMREHASSDAADSAVVVQVDVAQSAAPSEPQPYLVLHSESDEDDEELFDDEIKLADTNMELLEAEEEHDDLDDEEEFISMETSQTSVTGLGLGANLKTSKIISKSNETIAKRGGHQFGGHHPLADGQTGPVEKQTSAGSGGGGSSSAKSAKEAQKSRKRLRRLVASKFCLALLKQIGNSFDSIAKLNGIQTIPFFQVLSFLTEFHYFETDQKEFATIFNMVIKKMLDHLLKCQDVEEQRSEVVASPGQRSKKGPTQYRDRIERKPENEVLLLLMRFFSIFLQYFKRYPTISWQTFLAKDLPINESLRTIIQSVASSQCSKDSLVTFDEENIKALPSSSVVPSTSGANRAPVSIHQSLLLVAAQLIQSNGQILDYCYVMLHHLLKLYWPQINVVESESDSDKGKPVDASAVVYYCKKPIKIPPHMNLVPSDLRPFFTVMYESTPIFSVPATPASSQAGAQDTSGVTVINNTTNSCCNPSNSYTMINSIVFANNVFDHYPELLTEMSLRLPYQLKKLISFLNGQATSDGNAEEKTKPEAESKSPVNVEFGRQWIETLCEYMMLPSVTPYIRKHARKLLQNLCGSRERYRQLRDYYAIKTNLRAVRRIIVMHFFDSATSNLAFKPQDLGMTAEDLDDEDQLDELIRIIIGTFIRNNDKAMMMMSSDQHRLLNLPYAQLIHLVDYLKACLDIASTRIHNWQRLCRQEVRIVPLLFRISFLFGEGISSIILQLLSLALFMDAKNPSKKTDEQHQTHLIPEAEQTKSGDVSKTESKHHGKHQTYVCCYVWVVLDRQLLSHFIRFFLLESNSSQQRWATHSLLYMFFESLQPLQQEQFLQLFWQLWPNIACYGKRASQFVDLLGYFTLTLSRTQNESLASRLAENERIFAESALGLLRYQNQVLCRHPNSNIYNSLQPLLELNGYYLETEPCLVCNNPEINFVPVKLSSIKLDSRFTTNTQIVKLIGAHTISKIAVKISELKKSKMVKTLCIYYNNRCVQSVVELKNKNTVWHKAKRITLAPSQSEVKIEFALPIVACNLMIEYSNFYETSHSSTETLQCPRCSSIVPANPGVCTNCGENVFQCHKCRAINYDEKDPFLCNSCGFCKYAKFDYVLTARYTASAVEAIENEEDRSKAVQTINTLLDKADRLYKVILSIRPTLENLLLASHDYHNTLYPSDSMDTAASTNTASGSGSAPAGSSSLSSGSCSALYVNRYIHQLATRYSNDCRLHFEELSKIVQKILYTRKELVDYDNRQNDNRHNFEDIKRSLQEHRQDILKNVRGSTTSLSSTSSSTLVDVPTASTSAAGIKKQLKQALDDNYQGGEAKKKKLSNDDLVLRLDFKSGRCYGCATATIEHCIILLKALVCNPRYKSILGSSTLFRELIDYDLRIGTPSFRNRVRSLLCLLIRDDAETTEEFNNLLLEKIGSVLRTKFMTSFEFGSIRHEMSLLAASFENEDVCWEQRLRCVMKLFLLSLQNKSPAVLEVITLPCLRILCGLIKPSLEFNKKHDDSKSVNANHSANAVQQLATIQASSGLRALEKISGHVPFESLMVNVSVDLNQWLASDSKASFAAWQQRNLKKTSRSSAESDPAKSVQLEEYLMRKYFFRWMYLCQSGRIRNLHSECFIVRIATSTWIQEVLFNPTSKALRIACRQLLMALFERLTTKQRVLIDLFTSFLDDLCQVGGEIGLEFYDLYRSIVFTEISASANSANIVKNAHWRYYLALCGLLQHLGQLIATEIDRLKVLEETSLSSDFSQGSALRQLVELMQLFMRDERIRRVHKSSMVGFVLDGYLSLRKLIVQRTKMIDETQAALLELLELLTTGTKAETINFMKVCIESVKKCSLQDLRTPVFIFERLCSIIHPEEKDADEFFISLEKDPQQEDFLQGRMLGNPYSSKDSGMGPLMRNIKNKICQECELVSLLEDDSGLELLVNNKIISLDLPVKEVYKKIVCADAQASNQTAAAGANAWAVGSGNLNLPSEIALIDTSSGSVFHLSANLNPSGSGGAGGNAVSAHQSGPTMKIVYRIRGLMGDATEEFIENLSNKESIVKDDENLFELANIMSPSNGLGVMLERLQAINEINNRSRNLLFVLLKLFGYCVRVISNRRALIQPELNAISIMLGIVRLFLKNPQAELLTAPSAPGEPSYFEQLLAIMETLLAEASKENPEVFDRFNRETCGTPEDIQLLINAISLPDSIIFTANVTSLNHKILRVVTFISIGHPEKMTRLINNFRPYFEFDDYDRQNLPVEDPDQWYELFCSLVSAIECNHNGGRLKNRMIEEGFVSMAIDYLVRNAPPMKSFVLLNSEEWNEFTSRPALKYVLKMLTGMCRGHEPTQMLITKEGVPIIHALEQVLSDSHMATLAENLMEALKENPSVEAKIEEIRLKTREEKKRIAMAVREKQLGELGMKANDKGQVVADSDLLKKMEGELKEEKGLVCSICREGYAYQPQKVLAIYTFTKRCNVDEFEERKPRKTIGYTTVTHFNIVHVECHMDAVRHARTRDEWQSASLHNANTRCNGLLPLWGPNVYESLFAHALSRHNSYLQEAVGQRDFVGTNSFLGTVHDLKLLLLRFANERSFSEETGGGGAQSNLYLTPYLMHTALYVMNTTKVIDRERNSFQDNFMQQTPAKLFESCHQVESPYFYSTMVLLLHSHQFWNRNRLHFLRRLILCSVIRKLPADSRNAETLANTEPTYETIKPALMLFSLINLFYTIMFKTVEIKPDTDWSQALVDYIRHNDQSMMEAADRMLDTFENDILLSASFAEFCDASDLLRGSDAISDPDQFLKETLSNLSPA